MIKPTWRRHFRFPPIAWLIENRGHPQIIAIPLQNPWLHVAVESHPFGSAQGRL